MLVLQPRALLTRDFPRNYKQSHASDVCAPRRALSAGGMDFAKLSPACGVIAHLIGVLRTHA
jgi:hypothetical protein